ncbi:MAG: aldo/keto reductase [Gammaproteobacteria bacterium]|nr:aldo/keto reductase [Gammaproteobacteria bacterium]MCI0591797.1 aldo/keto reductase [Gammaproteobacteria bacterium]
MRRTLNGTDITVRAIGLGAMPLSIEGRPSEVQAFEVIKVFIECGGDFIDTANVYCLDSSDIGHNERLIHDALTRIGKRDAAIIATKGGLIRPKGAWEVDARGEKLRAACEKSLKDLKTDVIALYQLHASDPKVALADSLGELIRLKEEGKILHIGLSNIGPDELQLALRHTPIASVQNRCHPFKKRDLKNGMISMCEREGISYIPHSPVGGHFGHKRLPKYPLFQRLAGKYQASPYCIALAWLLHKGDHIIPIPGASKVSSVKDSATAVKVTLEPKDIEDIDRIPDE